jgi:hypothetical protein
MENDENEQQILSQSLDKEHKLFSIISNENTDKGTPKKLAIPESVIVRDVITCNKNMSNDRIE